MWRKAILLSLAWLVAVPIAAADVRVGLEVMQPRLILGEPLHVVITVQNTSGRILDLPFEPILAGMNPAVVAGVPGGGPMTTPAGTPLACEETETALITATFPWKMGSDFDIAVPSGQTVSFQCALVLPVALRSKAGAYGLAAHYEAQGRHLGQLGAVIGGPAPQAAQYVCNQCWKGTVDSAPVTITVEAPSGTDAAAYQAFKGDPLAHPSELLQRFPTSTYAGYALAQEVPDYSNPLFKPVPPADQVRRSRDEGKTVVAFPDKKFEAYFLHLDRFMQGGRVPESLRATLYGFYGDLLVQRGRFPEAEAAFQEAVKSKPSGGRALAYYERAKGFLSALQKK